MRNLAFLFTPWWGKTIGLALGYLTAGSAGAVFGIIIGNVFDIGLNNYLQTPQWHHLKRSSTEAKKAFLPALFRVMGHIAKADGVVQTHDIKIAKKIMRELGLYGHDKQLAIKHYTQGKAPEFEQEFEDTLRHLRQICYYNRNLLALFCESQYRSATIAAISDAKKDKINIVYNLLGYHDIFPERAGQRAYREETSATEEAKDKQKSNVDPNKHKVHIRMTDYEILGVKEGERAAIVKKAYRKLISKYHPDRLIAKNASQAQIDDATEKAQKIRAAYERIKKSRGF